MNASDDSQTSKPAYLVDTACGSRVPYEPDTTYVLFRGEFVFFCCSECKEGYESNPQTSCLAGRITSE